MLQKISFRISCNIIQTYRWVGDVVRSQSSTGQHSGQESQEEGQRKTTWRSQVRNKNTDAFQWSECCLYLSLKRTNDWASCASVSQAVGRSAEAQRAESSGNRRSEEEKEEERRRLQCWNPLWKEACIGNCRRTINSTAFSSHHSTKEDSIHLLMCNPQGFYDTSMEQYVPLEPNFKRLRQQHLDGELRRSVSRSN